MSLVSHTFTDSLTELTGDEQKVAKTTAFDVQLDPYDDRFGTHRTVGRTDDARSLVEVAAALRQVKVAVGSGTRTRAGGSLIRWSAGARCLSEEATDIVPRPARLAYS